MSNELQIWGGIECTVNRVGGTFHDQVERTGHAGRLHDLDLFAELGLRALRYPVLWERTAPVDLASADWSWPDERLARLRALAMTPIVGLVHHGSGPAHTSLLDADFPEKLADYASAVAGRYPWIEHYTPVNEPLTTARFSGLYGHWYPHHRSDASFVRALIQQTWGVVRAMQAIREINPAAKLVQTEDFGTIYATPPLRYQADFENERRWLTWDLLAGKVQRNHPLWNFLTQAGISARELDRFAQAPCPPDIVGVNHYVASDRFLDHRIERFPESSHGGNGRDRYVDIAAVRSETGKSSLDDLLVQISDRYRSSIAITEAHLGCTREEQLRWLSDIYKCAQRARERGARVEAVTVWSLLGAYDWDSLVTLNRGHYESGVFDVRALQPRPTALADLVKTLARGGTNRHPVLENAGWWHRGTPAGVDKRPLVIFGNGSLATSLAHFCEQRRVNYRRVTPRAEDIGATIDRLAPWGLINTVDYPNIDGAEMDPARCYIENVTLPAALARECARHGVRFLTFSSDLVFDGQTSLPYKESALVSPINVYGSSKATAEAAVLQAKPDALVIRTGALFGTWDADDFLGDALRRLRRNDAVDVATDIVVSPTYVPELANASLDLLLDGEMGHWHLANQGAVSWSDFTCLAAKFAGLDTGLVQARTAEALKRPARRPKYSALGSERALILESLNTALEKFVRAIDWERTAA